MKKWITSLLAAMMVLSLAACGNEATDVEKETPTQAPTEAPVTPTEAPTEAPTEVPTEAPTPEPASPAVYDGGYDLFFGKSTLLSTGAELFSLNMFNQAGLNPVNGWWGDPEALGVKSNETLYLQHLTLIENGWKNTYGFGASQSFVCGIPYFEWYNDNNTEAPALAIKKPESSEGYYTLIISTPLRVDAAETIGWTFDENDEVVCREALACLLSVFSTEPTEIADTIIEDLHGEKSISDSEFTVVGDAGIKFDSASYSFTSESCNSVYYIKAK